jgi:cytochrome c oxidase subunit IV
MTSTTSEPVVPHPVHTGEHGDTHAHDWDYIKIALILMVLTLMETSTYFIDWFQGNGTRQWLFLGPLMALKFFLVAWFFMHLKQDSRIFSRLFLTGIVVAVGVYMIVFFAFDQFF